MKLSQSEQKIVQDSLRASFDNPNTDLLQCNKIVRVAQKMGLEKSWLSMMKSDLSFINKERLH